MTSVSRWGPLLVVVATVGCGDSTTAVVAELADGAYTLSMARPILVDPLVTPTWMGWDLDVEITKSGPDVTVTGSSMGLVILGPVQRYEPEGTAWRLELAWSQTHDGDHYWAVDLTDQGCVGAAAVDADLGIGPDGVWTVDLQECSIVTR